MFNTQTLQMDYKVLGVFCCLWFYLCIPQTDSLWCYQCANVNMGSPCVTDYKGMNKSAITKEGKYAKDCSNQYIGQSTNQTNETRYYCLIEIHKHGGGGLLNFRRDCSDGVHFSYNYDPKVKDVPHLSNLKPNNVSSCWYLVDKQICLRLCDTDFCNGPEPNQTVPEPCVEYYFPNGTNYTCGAMSQLFTRHPVVFGTLIDGIVGNILTVPLFVLVLLVLILH